MLSIVQEQPSLCPEHRASIAKMLFRREPPLREPLLCSVLVLKPCCSPAVTSGGAVATAAVCGGMTVREYLRTIIQVLRLTSGAFDGCCGTLDTSHTDAILWRPSPSDMKCKGLAKHISCHMTYDQIHYSCICSAVKRIGTWVDLQLPPATP